MDKAVHAAAVAPFQAEVQRLRPPGAEIIEAHAHLGLDEDGRSLDPETLLDQLDLAGAQRACVFPLHDPDRHPAYRVPNDRVLAWAAASRGRLIPFCRLDPDDGPLEEGHRSLAAGARGIKLHPRAQGFHFGHEAVEGIFGLAEEAKVPILIHTGRGLPPIADGLADVALRHPSVVLILAHAAIADQGILTSRLAEHPNVLYDICTWSSFDLLELFARVPAERVVFASDPPYGHPATGLYMALRVAQAVGLDDQALRAVLGATMAAVIDGHELPQANAPIGGAFQLVSNHLMRIQAYLLGTGPALFTGNLEMAKGGMELSLAACRDPNPGPVAPTLQDIAAALQAALTLLADYDPEGKPEALRPVLDLVQRCMICAATEPLPDGAALAAN